MIICSCSYSSSCTFSYFCVCFCFCFCFCSCFYSCFCFYVWVCFCFCFCFYFCLFFFLSFAFVFASVSASTYAPVCSFAFPCWLSESPISAVPAKSATQVCYIKLHCTTLGYSIYIALHVNELHCIALRYDTQCFISLFSMIFSLNSPILRKADHAGL